MMVQQSYSTLFFPIMKYTLLFYNVKLVGITYKIAKIL
jgi:hypothetical protein